MFYYLYEIFNINLFGYLTVRAGISFFLAFVFSVFFMPKFIHWAKTKNAEQPIYELAPKAHQAKSKTPTMGGIVFIGSALLASLLCVNLTNAFVLLGFSCFLAFVCLDLLMTGAKF